MKNARKAPSGRRRRAPRSVRPPNPRLEPLTRFADDIVALWPLADQLADRMLTTLCAGTDVLTQDVAREMLVDRLMAMDPARNESDDERQGRELCAIGDAAFMLGMALGRRLGPIALRLT